MPPTQCHVSHNPLGTESGPPCIFPLLRTFPDHAACPTLLETHREPCCLHTGITPLQAPPPSPHLASSVMKLWQNRITSASDLPLGLKSLPPCRRTIQAQTMGTPTCTRTDWLFLSLYMLFLLGPRVTAAACDTVAETAIEEAL